MCGILVVFGYKGNIVEFRPAILELSKKLRHRGPDWNGLRVVGQNILCHERLAIVGVDSGAQPLTGGENESITLCVNGEIYNHIKLRSLITIDYQFKTESDCEIVIPLYLQYGEDFVDMLDGKFSFALYDSKNDRYMAARDPIGVTSLYQGWGRDGSIWFSSEMKAINEVCEKVEPFLPGHVYSSQRGLYRWYKPKWWSEESPTTPADLKVIREKFEEAVVKRLMTDVPYGVLLSGGLDSSLVASITVRNSRNRVEDGGRSEAWWPRVHSFAIGLPGAPDLKYAVEVAKFLGTVHHEYHFTVQEGLDAIRDVVYATESYDVTTIRASTPMFLLARKIKATGVKMVLSGEGSDEVFGGYLYFHQAPSADEFHKETCRRVKNLHLSDCLRAHKSMMAWGVESRVPFLDKGFLDVAMGIDPKDKMCSPGKIEKYILRKAFDDKENPYLPDNILWRQKEQFSDGVGYSWIDSLKDFTSSQVSDAEFQAAAIRFPYNTPATKEAYFYRNIFSEKFPQRTCDMTVMKWVPREDWGCSSDPSGRAQKVHAESLEKETTKKQKV